MRDFDDIFDILDKIMEEQFTGAYKRQTKQKEETVDYTEDDEHIYITIDLNEMEIPDDNINVIPIEDALSIEFDIEGRWYRRTWNLPSKIDPIMSKIEYNNRVLDITLFKVEDEPRLNNNDGRERNKIKTSD